MIPNRFEVSLDSLSWCKLVVQWKTVLETWFYSDALLSRVSIANGRAEKLSGSLLCKALHADPFIETDLIKMDDS